MSGWRFLSFCLVAFILATMEAHADPWLQVSTPHFRVISNAGEKEARRTAVQFERMRSVFARVFPNQPIDTATPIVVLALQDRPNFQMLEPASYLVNGQLKAVGFFMRAPEKNYVLILLGVSGLHPYAGIYHEYAHFVQNQSGDWMPLWLTEGWAQFYQTAEILDSEVIIGKLEAATWDFLQRNQLLPIAALLTADAHSPYYHEEDKGSMFYAESWALTHYLEMKDARENTHRVQDYLDLVHKNVDSLTAASQAFGDLSTLQSGLHKYIANPDFDLIHIAGSTNVDDFSFQLQPLTQSQVNTVRGDVMAYNSREAEAEALLKSVLEEDPGNVPARVTMGYLAFRRRDFDDTRRWCEEALKRDPENLLANYYLAGALLNERQLDAASQAKVEASLSTVIKVNPSFAPAYYGLGLLYTMQGKNHQEAQRWLLKAIEMDPGNVEFRIDYANLLIQMNKRKEAEDALQLALKMAHTPEQTADAENVLQTLHRSSGAAKVSR